MTMACYALTSTLWQVRTTHYEDTLASTMVSQQVQRFHKPILVYVVHTKFECAMQMCSVILILPQAMSPAT